MPNRPISYGLPVFGIIVLWLPISTLRNLHGQSTTDAPYTEVLSESQRQEVDDAVSRALLWLAQQQRPDGSFPSIDSGQPAVTSFCIIAFLANGHHPGQGPYGGAINWGIDFVLSSQQEDGLISYVPPRPPLIDYRPSHAAAYNHPIGGVCLGEVFGIVDESRNTKIARAVRRAIDKSLDLQNRPKRNRVNRDGWRYVLGQKRQNDADLSVTAWELTFLRAAKNAGFDVPEEPIRKAQEYVMRCFDAGRGTFIYAPLDGERHDRRPMAAAGILAMAAAGSHDRSETEAAGKWLLRHSFRHYNAYTGRYQRLHYEAFYCSQAMFQLGGKYWEKFYPQLVETLIANQNTDSSWDAENGPDRQFGNAYTTALAVLALSPPNQLLPVFQR